MAFCTGRLEEGLIWGSMCIFFYLPVQIRRIELKNAQNYWKVLNPKDDF